MNKIEYCFEVYIQQITLHEEVSTDSDEKKNPKAFSINTGC